MGWAAVLLVFSSLAGGTPSIPAGLGEVCGLASDPPPDQLTNDTHYLVSNERRLDLLREDVEGSAGVYIGVGAAQNYLLAGWASPSFMVLVDFDQDVVDLHALHTAFLAHASDGEQFEALWSEESTPTVRRLLAVAAPEPTRRARLMALYARARPDVAAGLAKTRARSDELGVPTYLSDDAQYGRIAALARTGKIVAKRGDFTQPGVVLALGDALRNAGAHVGVLYLSNIEQYFMYGEGYRSNISGLPMNAHTAVLRTLPARPAGFEYIAQRGDHMQAWVASKHVRSVYRVRGMTKGMERPASTRIEVGPPPPRRLRAGKPK
ncbi:MAG: hypothetical protein ACE37F_17920 [Nannocystaceae bacterium]|nr:hypothetical protein [bacterium]